MACSRPIPRPAPVTIATRPSQRRVIWGAPWFAGVRVAGRFHAVAAWCFEPHRSLQAMDPTKAPDVTCDVLVVGAGPAGAAAAITLQRADLATIVVDRARFPRDKCCGDGLTTLALRELESLGFDPAGVTGWFDVDAAWLRSPSGREVCLPLPSTGRY